MEVVNPFILKNKERMIVFLDQLSNVSDPNPPPGTYIEPSSNHTCTDTGKSIIIILFDSISFLLIKTVPLTGRDLATLHHICNSYLPELQVLSKTAPSIKKLVTVSEMLTKHKLKYREMISNGPP